MWRVVLLLGLLGIVFGLGFGIRSLRKPTAYRTSFVVAGSPSAIVSFTDNRQKVTVVLLPSDVSIEASYGYGRYTIGALFALDRMEKKNGTLFTTSIRDAIGVPVIGLLSLPHSVSQEKDGVVILRSLFSPMRVMRSLVGSVDGVMSVPTYLSYALSSWRLSSDAVTTVSTLPFTVQKQEPDGSSSLQFDQNTLDYGLNTVFLDTGIRSEALSVALYNTTSIPLLAQKIGRIVAHLGVNVVVLGNDPSEKTSCQMRGSQQAHVSKTAMLFRDVFGCTFVDGDHGVADLSVYLGTTEAKPYQSR